MILVLLLTSQNRIFTLKSIASLGKFQNKGLKHNNLIKLTLKEIKVLFLNNPFAKRSTLKVSLGTSKALDDDPKMYSSSS
jgi:hypothetical protein